MGLLNGVTNKVINRAVLITNEDLELLGEHTVATRHLRRLPRRPFRLRDEAVLRRQRSWFQKDESSIRHRPS
jgi:hypothetical protein